MSSILDDSLTPMYLGLSDWVSFTQTLSSDRLLVASSYEHWLSVINSLTRFLQLSLGKSSFRFHQICLNKIVVFFIKMFSMVDLYSRVENLYVECRRRENWKLVCLLFHDGSFWTWLKLTEFNSWWKFLIRIMIWLLTEYTEYWFSSNTFYKYGQVPT